MIIEFIKEYIDQNMQYKEVLLDLSKKGNVEEIKNICHKLKGSAINLRINYIVDILTKIQNRKEIDLKEFEKDVEEVFDYLSYLAKQIDSKFKLNKENKKIKDLNLNRFAGEIGLKRDEYIKFLKDFAQTLEDSLTTKTNNIEQEAKKLKNIAINLKLDNIAKILKDIKTDLDFNEHKKDIQEMVEEIKAL